MSQSAAPLRTSLAVPLRTSLAAPLRTIWSLLAGKGVVTALALVVVGGIILPEALKIVTAPWAVTWLPGSKLVGIQYSGS
jgi:hypothetical protein